MDRFIAGYLAGFSYVFGVIAVISLLYKLLKLDHEISRKLIHVCLFYTWVILYKYFYPDWQMIIIPIAFIAVNYLSFKLKLFKVIERETENHMGTVYFAIAMTLLMSCVLIWPKTIAASGIAVFCLCFGDGFAAIFGVTAKKPIHITRTKTLAGTAACFVTSFIGIALCAMFVPFEVNYLKWLVIALISAAAELLGKGLDNFSITFLVYAASILILN